MTLPIDRTRSFLQLLVDISRELSTTLDSTAILKRVLMLSAHNMGAERGSLITLDLDKKPLDAAIVVGDVFLPHTLQHLKEIIENGLARLVIESCKPALIEDTSRDERWMHRPDDDPKESGAKSALCVPLLAQDELVGVLTLVHPVPGFFNGQDLEQLQAIADLAALAVRNARLYDSLDEAHKLYRDLFQDNIDPCLITDWEGRVLEANRQAAGAINIPQQDLAGLQIADLHDMNWEVLGIGYGVVRSGEMLSYESILHCASGQHIPVIVYARSTQYFGGEAIQWILRDIRERRQLDLMREDLAAMIYHDLRSPLSNIVSSLDILPSLLPKDASPTVNSILQIATRSADRMQRMISSLLDIHRLESGQSILSLSPVKVDDLAMEALETVRPYFESRQQQVEICIPVGLPCLNVDGDMIRRVIINLLENAGKYSPMKSKVVLGAGYSEGWITIWVKDEGPGVPEEAHLAIFEKFIRLPRESHARGMGLGLSFCRLAVQVHGGKIWVESQPQEGSCFKFSLPVLQN